MNDLWLMILTVGGIFLFALVCGLRGQKKEKTEKKVEFVPVSFVEFMQCEICKNWEKCAHTFDDCYGWEEKKKLDPETVRQEMLDQLSLRAAGDKLSELKRRRGA